MEWKDNPEDLIRELESQLTDQSSTSELGAAVAPPPPTYGAPFPPTPVKTGLRVWWVLLGVLVVGAVVLAAGVAVFSAHISSTPRSSISSPTSAPGSTAPAGAPLTIAGFGQNKTVACNSNAMTVSGASNTIVITGHSASLTVTGMKNTITVDAADTIETDGFNNQVTYHSGTPTVSNFGDSNVVQQG